MDPKERVFTALEHRTPDRVPVTNRFTPEIARDLATILGLDSTDTFDLEVELDHDILCTKEMGIVNVYLIENSKEIEDDKYIDDFGVIKKKVSYGKGHYVEIVKNPLEDINSFSTYTMPDPDRQPLLQSQLKNLKDNVKKYGKTHAIVGGVTATIFEGSEILRGIERIMVDLVDNQDFLNELFDMLVDYHLKIGKMFIEIGVDIVYIGDDVGMQRGMLISPDLWRKLLKPRYDYLLREWKKLNSNIKFALHSDGHIEPIVEDLVEIGLDILNPVQPGTMDDRWLKKEFGRKLSFWGGINVQKTMPFGTLKEVINEVKDRIGIFGPGGGFIISPSHNIQPNIRSIDNTMTYYWACRKYGKYDF